MTDTAISRDGDHRYTWIDTERALRVDYWAGDRVLATERLTEKDPWQHRMTVTFEDDGSPSERLGLPEVEIKKPSSGLHSEADQHIRDARSLGVIPSI